MNQKNRAYYHANREKQQERVRAYKAEHREKQQERVRAYKAEHREEVNKKLREWHARNKNKVVEYHRRANEILRKAVFDHYGWACIGCGELDSDVLTIDHTNGDGKMHRTSMQGSLYSWLKRNNFPPGFRTLCWNCNSGRAARGRPLPNEKRFKEREEARHV